jgi:hypothetical protein
MNYASADIVISHKRGKPSTVARVALHQPGFSNIRFNLFESYFRKIFLLLVHCETWHYRVDEAQPGLRSYTFHTRKTANGRVMKRNRTFCQAWIVTVMLSLAFLPSAVASTSTNADSKQASDGSTEVGKLQSFNIGARSGSYERWDLNDIGKFDGASMTIKVDKIDKEGRGEKKRWASGFRLILDEKPQADSTAESRYILAFTANRETRVLSSQLITDGESSDLGFELEASLPITISVSRIDDEFIRIVINERSYKIRCDLKIRYLAVSSSGMSISTNDLVLLPPGK